MIIVRVDQLSGKRHGFLNIRHILMAPIIPEGMPLVYKARDGWIYENKDVQKKFFIPRTFEQFLMRNRRGT